MSLPDTSSDFWSRRKAAVRSETEAEQALKQRRADEAETAEQVAQQAGKSDAEILDGLGLVAPEKLEAGDDFKAFLAKAVPEHLRKRALRQLWGTNPVLANLDGLVDYDEDFTAGSVAVGALKTVYQVGRGAVARLEEADEDSASAHQADTQPEQTAQGYEATEPESQTPSDAPATMAQEPLHIYPDDTVADAAAVDAPPRPRPMQFTFTDEITI